MSSHPERLPSAITLNTVYTLHKIFSYIPSFDSMDRRQALRLLGLGAVALSGCSTANQRPETNVTTKMPTPSSPCEVSSLPDGEYPDLPSELTNTTARAFAEEFEKGFAKATIQEGQTKNFSGFDGWDTNIRETTDKGYIISVQVRVDYGSNPTNEHTTTDLGGESFNAVYYVTGRFAMRFEGDWSGSISESGWETVACENE